jgi:hypothetical protein
MAARKVQRRARRGRREADEDLAEDVVVESSYGGGTVG